VTYVVGSLSAHAIVGDGRGLFEGNAYVMRDPQQIESMGGAVALTAKTRADASNAQFAAPGPDYRPPAAEKIAPSATISAL
jgi:hypothetical protein